VKPRIAITAGDFNGIAPEVILKSLRNTALLTLCTPVLVGPRNVFQFYAGLLGFDLQMEPAASRRLSAGAVRLVESSDVSSSAIHPGTLSSAAGSAAAEAITCAVSMAMRGDVDAIVTGPVSKQALHLAGVHYPGQTEMVQELSHSRRVAMMLVSDTLRVGLVTIHEPISRVPKLVTTALLRERIATIHAALSVDWGIRKPKLAVLGLNPHAGEGGDIGREEQRVVIPVLNALRRKGMLIDGPFPADAFFGRYDTAEYDGVVAMYHDQGLIPLKMSSAGKAVNVSVGLRIIRTSPDHGTAFDRAGRGIADPGSMIAAIKLAVRIAHNRQTAHH
jgi:4-hydroxythreonine-4-phosphate dehydrogenase